MADKAEVHIGENSPEYVAYRLYTTLRNLSDADRKKHLAMYAECLMAVSQPEEFSPE